MSLAKTIDRLARVVKAEARRNPEFAARLEAALLAHTSRRSPPEIAAEAIDALAVEEALPAPLLNPVAVVGEAGPEGLAAALSTPSWSRADLIALAREHNLDPAGEAEALDGEALVAHLVAQAKKRVDRDRKLFDY